MMDERFSALLDGELGDDEAAEVLQRIQREPELRAAWTRQYQIHAMLRGQAVHGLGDRLSERVRAQLTQPAVQNRNVVDMTERLLRNDGAAESRAAAISATVATRSLRLARSAVASLPQNAVELTPPRRRTLAAGLALAASLAAAAVLVPRLNGVGTPASQPGASRVADVGWTGVDPATAHELDEYLLDHHSVAESSLVSLPAAAQLANTGRLLDASYQQH